MSVSKQITYGLGSLLGLLYLLLFNELRLEWSINPQYAYGWIIPVLCFFLLLERWSTRPPVSSAPEPIWLVFPLIIAFLAYFPIRMILEAHPDYYLVLWMKAFLVVGVTLCFVHWLGGWRWTVHFFFPFAFVLVAVPWPLAIEAPVMEYLMQKNANFAAEMLTLAGLPALAQGNVIELRTETLGVDEACSGVRSLQSTFMMALFLGEFYLLTLGRRSLLLLAGLAFAVVTNLGRTITLALIATHHGSAVMDEWHDPIGYIVLGICLGGLWLITLLIKRGNPPPEKDLQTKYGAEAMSRPPRLFPIKGIVFMIGWLIFVEVAIEGWFRYNERGIEENPQWRVAWPSNEEQFDTQEMQERAAAILKYNEAEAASWVDENGFFWSMYFILWEPGRVSARLGASHTPAICMPAVGNELIDRRPITWIDVEGLQMPFTPYLFSRGGIEFYVFHCLWEDRQRDSAIPASQEERIRAALRGERNLGQRILGISVVGPETFEEAEALVTQRLREIIYREDSSDPAIRQAEARAN